MWRSLHAVPRRLPSRSVSCCQRGVSTGKGWPWSPSVWRTEGPIHVLGGIAFFVGTERATAVGLHYFGVELPPSVTALCALGTIAAVPSLGARVQFALGPAAAWMRASLPLVLCPAFLFPAICELPERDAIPKLALLATAGMVVTCGTTGHLVAALAAKAATSTSPAVHCAASAAAANSVVTSARIAFVALGFGAALSAIGEWRLASPSQQWVADPAVVRAPFYIGATFAIYVAANTLLPAQLRTLIPPNVGSALVLFPFLLGIGQLLGEPDTVRSYLDGAGAALLWTAQPAMVTLGLYSHTHRSVLLEQRVALAALSLVGAPGLLFALAYAGSSMDLAPRHIASILPASTTTGLALTMPSGLHLIQQEWVAAGTAFNSALVQLTCPLLLGITALTTPFARGVGVGCTAHVGGMVALIAAGETAAADAAAVALVCVGVGRSVWMRIPIFSQALAKACGEEPRAAGH